MGAADRFNVSRLVAVSWAGVSALVEIELVDVIAEVRRELIRAVTEADGATLQFPVGQVTLQFQVGVTRTGEGGGGVKLWVLDLKSSGRYAREVIQTVTVMLDPPVDASGRPIKVVAGPSSRQG